MSALDLEITVDGNLRLSAAQAERWFPSDSLVALPRGDELWLVPLTGPEAGGLLLKQRTPAGDRSALIHEVLPLDFCGGRYPAVWDDGSGALRMSLAAVSPSTQEPS
ncbi:MAG: hydrogenase maturation protease [Acidimicrobiales bacterium]